MKKNYRILTIVEEWPRHLLWTDLCKNRPVVKSVAWALVQLRNERVTWPKDAKIEEVLEIMGRTSFYASYAEIAKAASCSRRHAIRAVALLIGIGLLYLESRGNGELTREDESVHTYVNANTYLVPNWTAEKLDLARRLWDMSSDNPGNRTSNRTNGGDALSPDESLSGDALSPKTVELVTGTAHQKEGKISVPEVVTPAPAYASGGSGLRDGATEEEVLEKCRGLLRSSPGAFRDIIELTEHVSDEMRIPPLEVVSLAERAWYEIVEPFS